MNRWSIALVVALVVIAASAIPRPVAVAPEWKLTLVDETNKPMPGISVEESWQHYSLEESPHGETRLTDRNGTTVFPERMYRSSPLWRFVGCVRQIAQSAVHASCGPHSWLAIGYPEGFGQNDVHEFAQAELNFSGGASRRNDLVVIHRCKNGGTGTVCFPKGLS